MNFQLAVHLYMYSRINSQIHTVHACTFVQIATIYIYMIV